MTAAVLTEARDRVLSITLNAHNLEMRARLTEAFERFENDDAGW